ncbi:MAG: phosphatidylglycerophosphatase A, partial [Natronomonas sp.]|nr:phosphatidylglycerophosphatase A [Natronomonas sp.]
FDVLKPPPISTAEGLPGALGVMADDLLAGVAAALVVTLAAFEIDPYRRGPALPDALTVEHRHSP